MNAALASFAHAEKIAGKQPRILGRPVLLSGGCGAGAGVARGIGSLPGEILGARNPISMRALNHLGYMWAENRNRSGARHDPEGGGGRTGKPGLPRQHGLGPLQAGQTRRGAHLVGKRRFAFCPSRTPRCTTIWATSWPRSVGSPMLATPGRSPFRWRRVRPSRKS